MRSTAGFVLLLLLTAIYLNLKICLLYFEFV